MDDATANELWKNEKNSQVWILAMYTERWLNRLNQGPGAKPMIINKQVFDGEVPLKYFEKHALIASKGMHVEDWGHSVKMTVTQRPALTVVRD